MEQNLNKNLQVNTSEQKQSKVLDSVKSVPEQKLASYILSSETFIKNNPPVKVLPVSK